ncbi:MAG: hypothetical protein JWP87_3350 [Labilithrix sp.]|nr:hypothetical protein [Labilithrix sp.]
MPAGKDPYARRFVVAATRDEGIVLDVATGEIYRADRAAAIVFRALARGDGVTGAAAALARSFDVSRARAERDVRAILRTLSAARPRATASSWVFRPSGRGGYDLLHDGRRVAWIDARGRAVERPVGQGEEDAEHVLRLAAPHVLALRRKQVLHASAVVVPSGVVAFVAPSGTGKTTIARLLARRGLRVIAEDLLVLATPRDAVLDGERAIRAWSRSRAPTVPSDAIVACAANPSKPLRAVYVVERTKAHDGLVADPLRGAAAIAALFANAFVELPCARVWRDALAACRALATLGIVHRLRVPDGLAALERALAVGSDPHDPVEALLGRLGPDPRVADAVTAKAEHQRLVGRARVERHLEKRSPIAAGTSR